MASFVSTTSGPSLRNVTAMNGAQGPNIVLTGFMGTGKSAVGRRIAAETGRAFVDIDAEIVAKYGSIPELFASGGEERFREIEREIVAEFAPMRNQVIATGGGTMLDNENVVSFLGAEIFTLTASAEEIEERVTADGIESRPLLAESENPAETITRLLAEREDAYSKFTQIDTSDKSVDQVVDALRDAGASISPAAEFDPVASKNNADRILYAIVGVVGVIALIVLVLILTY